MSVDFTHISGNMYLVRSQEGYEKALKHWETFIDGGGLDQLTGFPVSFPSLITINSKYRGYLFAEVEAITFTDLKEAMNKFDQSDKKGNPNV